ncbi:ATP-grasp domain-containing protein [Streptomyces sp. NPDC051569]|uniref:ATP-grasp domain-containing protein n=1 Tax=Streptomyces sp. NPDC051569 TaxID=3365661 RepID=UPI00379BAABA
MTAELLVLVESNTTGTGRLFPAAARDLGLRPVLLAADPGRYTSVGGAEVVRTDTDSPQEVIAACRRLGATRRIAGITTSSDYFVETASTAGVELGLPAHSPGAIRSIQDKGVQRRLLAEGGVRVPRFAVAATVRDATDAALGLGFPVVLKPVTGSGSLGVHLCADAAEVTERAAALLARETNERGRPIPRRLLVEEFVRGAEYSVEVLSDTVIGVTRKYLGELPSFVETGHDFPAPLAPSAYERIASTALAAVRGLGLVLGPAHVELRMDGDEPVLIEVNPRLAGGWIPRLVQEATGIDLIHETVKAFSGRASGVSAPVRATRAGAAAIRFVLAPGDGELTELRGVADARAVPGVIEVEPYRSPGAALTVAGDFRDRIGHVLAHAGAVADAAAAATEGARLVRPVLRAVKEPVA